MLQLRRKCLPGREICVKQTQKSGDFPAPIGRGCRFTAATAGVKIKAVSFCQIKNGLQSQEAFLWFLNGCCSWVRPVP